MAGWGKKGALRMEMVIRRMRGLGVAGLILLGILLNVGAVTLTVAPARAQVTTIAVEGNQRVEVATIRSYFKFAPGGQLDHFQIDEGIKGLYATGLFQDIRPSISGSRLLLVVVENPVINRIAFEGNKKVKDDQLKLEIQSKERGTLSRPAVQSDVQRVAEVYRRSGRFDVQVVPQIIELPNNRVDLVFEINEGDKTGIKTIEFVGNRAYSSYRLKDVIKTSETGLLAFLQTTNIYDGDRLEADRELLRRFYLKHGYIDVRVVSATGQYDPATRGFVVVFTIEEGEQYRIGTVDVVSNVRNLDANLVRPRLRAVAGDIYNAEMVEKSVEDMTIEASRQGYAFASVRPRADRNFQAHLVNLVFAVEEGQHAYIERINVRGNTRTRDYVIRREFDVAEGDAYNRALISRAERRLKNLNFFKAVRITTEPGSAPDRLIVNVDLEEMSTGEISVAGGFSTADGFMAEFSVGERNLLGRGQYTKASVQYGQYTRGFNVSFVEPFFLGYRMALGLDAFAKQQLPTNFVSYQTKTLGANARLGFALREDLSLQVRYSIYRQSISLPALLNNCNNISPDFINTFPTPGAGILPPAGYTGTQTNCYQDGEASLAVRKELANGSVLTSLVGYTLGFNTLDDNRSPTSGTFINFNQDFAGVGGDVKFMRQSVDSRTYYEVVSDLIGVLHLQGGYIRGLNGDVRMLDHFQMGPNLVRGFTPAGIGPRDLTLGTSNDALGGSTYWGASFEVQTPLYFLPKDSGIKVAAYVDAGSVWNYVGPTFFNVTGENLTLSNNNMFVNSSVGVGLLWASPFGPIRFDFAYPITKQPFDRTQFFRFSGGTSF
jgi:outer membrane protein insertion porin family